MITSPFTVLRPTAPGLAPGTAVLAGPAGASAYQLALAAGFVGTVTQWLASLVGPGATAAQVFAAVQSLAIGTTAGTIAAGNDPRIVGAAPLLSPPLAGTPTVILPVGAQPTDGAFATDGTQSWQPSSFGHWASATMSITVNPTRGTPKDANGNPASYIRSMLLTQAQGDGSQAVHPVGHFINFDVVGGPYSAANGAGGVTNSVGQLISVRQRPDAAGNSPGYAWTQNLDFHIAPGAGKVQSYGTEIDMNNFNRDGVAGGGSICAHVFLNGIAAYPGTCYVLGNAGTTQSFSGTVTTNGTTVTLITGNAFTPAITRITIGGVVYRVNYVDGSHLNITSVPPANITTAVAYSASSAMVHDGILFGGDNQISDNEVHLSTAAYNAVTIDGKHNVGVNIAGDAATYAVTMRAGQAVCFNNFGAPLSYSTSSAGLTYNGQIVLADNGNIATPGSVIAANAVLSGSITAASVQASSFSAPTNSKIVLQTNRGIHLTISDPGTTAANHVNIISAQAGVGPTVSALGSDTNVPLVLQSQGASPTLINGAAVVASQLEVRGPLGLGNFTVATAPLANPGYTAYFTNAVKPGESSGSGTGVIGVYTNGAWRRLPDYAALAA